MFHSTTSVVSTIANLTQSPPFLLAFPLDLLVRSFSMFHNGEERKLKSAVKSHM